MSSEAPKRSLLAIGVSSYDAIPNSDLPSVDQDLEILLPVFHDLGFSLVYPEGLRNPEGREASDAVAEWLEDVKHTEHDQLVLYLSGHGVYDVGDFFLGCRDTPYPLTPRKALSAQGIVKDFASQVCNVNHLLVIIDACHSGAWESAVGDIGKVLDVSQQRGDAKKVHYIASSTQRDPAPANSAFALALREAITKPSDFNAGVSQEFLYMQGIAEQINLNKKIQARYSTYNSDANVRFFRNPYFDPNNSNRPLPEQPRRERMLSETDRVHYNTKARGVNAFHDEGNFFTGRHAALRKLVAWLQDDQPNALVVTGDPGAGKSSLLGRLVMSAEKDAAKREEYLAALPEDPPPDTLPPPGSIQVAVHARNLHC